MWKLLQAVSKKLVLAIPVSMAVGLMFGIVFEKGVVVELRKLIIPLTILMVYPMMVSLNIQHLKKGFNARLQITTQLINFLLIPFFAFFVGKLFFSEQPYLLLGLLLAALLPTSGMTISWTGFAGGNVGAAINMTVVGLTLGSLATPVYVQTLLGAQVEVDLVAVFLQIGMIVFLPMLFGNITRLLLLKKYGQKDFKEKYGPRFPAISTLGVLGIVFVAMALKADTLFANPAHLVRILLALIVLYGVNFLVSTAVAKTVFERADGIALVYGTVMRNLSIALAVAINSFGEAGTETALVIALAYIIQVQSAAWYVKATDAIFGVVK